MRLKKVQSAHHRYSQLIALVPVQENSDYLRKEIKIKNQTPDRVLYVLVPTGEPIDYFTSSQ